MNQNKTEVEHTPDSKKQTDFLAKILVIGDGGVGKTSLITRFTDHKFVSSYTATIGVDFKSKILAYNGKTVKLQIWDTAGQERFRNITQAYYRGASGILLSFSVTDPRSFQNIEKWVSQMDQNAPKECCKVLVATKIDCESQRNVTSKEGEILALKMGIPYLQTSSKTGEGVQQIFSTIGRMVYQTSLKKKNQMGGDSIKIKNSSGQQQKKRCSC